MVSRANNQAFDEVIFLLFQGTDGNVDAWRSTIDKINLRNSSLEFFQQTSDKKAFKNRIS